MPAIAPLLIGALSAGSSIASGIAQGDAADEQGKFQKQQYEMNAKIADLQAGDAIKRGDKEAQNIQTKGKQAVGSQRAAAAAQGLDVNSGSALDIQADTAGITAQDALTTRNNAWREAWGFKTEAANMTSQGNMAERAGQNAKSNSIVAGGLNGLAAAGKGYYDYRKGIK